MCSSDLRYVGSRLAHAAVTVLRSSGDAWCRGGVLGEKGDSLGRVWEEGEQNGGDQKGAAPSGTVMPVVITVLGMPEAASSPNSHLRDPNRMGFSPLCAKFKTLPLC